MEAIQDRLFPLMNCFGCGPVNERGLRLKSYRADEGTVATFLPWPEHDNGGGYLNGGIIATLLDCHGASAVLDLAYERDWCEFDGASLGFVTAGLDVHYRRPTPLTEQLDLTARVLEGSPEEITVHSAIVYDDKVRAEGTAVWKRWRPRPS
ncbi:MAG: PaaI family thioesterase [Nocardioidaceae bacterium]